jgi:hypothetical protein
MAKSDTIRHLVHAFGRGVVIGMFAISVRRDIYGKPLLAVAHVGFAHPVASIVTECMDMRVLNPLFAVLRNACGLQIAVVVLALSTHLLTFSAFDYLGVMPGGHAGFVETFIKPSMLAVVRGCTVYAFSRLFPTAHRGLAICAEIATLVAAARCIARYV